MPSEGERLHRQVTNGNSLGAQEAGMPDLLYLDYNCFQRAFDDPQQARIRMEAAACEQIFEDAEKAVVDLVWSFMHEDENVLCPFADRKLEIRRLSAACRVQVVPDEQVRTLAKKLETEAGLSAKDAVHVAAAHCAGAAFFVTCDDRILSKASRLPVEIVVINPVQYVLRKG